MLMDESQENQYVSSHEKLKYSIVIDVDGKRFSVFFSRTMFVNPLGPSIIIRAVLCAMEYSIHCLKEKTCSSFFR